MSCDFGILSLDKKLTNEEASLLYQELLDENTQGVISNNAISNFYQELTGKHPEIDDIPEDQIDDTDLCPWSIAFEKSDGHLIICCVWPKADYVFELLSSLATKYNLAIFDPQSETIVYPDGSDGGSNKPWWKFW